MLTFDLPVYCGLGGCVDICTSHANGGGSVTRPRGIGVQVVHLVGGLMGDGDLPSLIIGEPD